MHNLFTMAELIEADPCEDGLSQLTSGLGTYSGLTTVTVDDLKPMGLGDIIWGLKLLPISDHAQKAICVKTAIYADAAWAARGAHATTRPKIKAYLIGLIRELS